MATPIVGSEINTQKIDLYVMCPKCHVEHKISIDSNIITRSLRFPVKYAFIHGEPKFILTLFIDRQFQIRGIEVSEYLEMQREDLDRILDDNRSNTLKDLSAAQIFVLIFIFILTQVFSYYYYSDSRRPCILLRSSIKQANIFPLYWI